MNDKREKLIELLFKSLCKHIHKSCKLAENIADDLIANGVTIQKWIPVTERLPEDDLPKDSNRKSIKVLVAYQTSSGAWVVRTQIREKGRWYSRPKEWDWAKNENITHWMPLPEAPKGE